MNEKFLESAKEKVKDFYRTNYAAGIGKLIISGNKEEILETRKCLEGNIIGFHAIFCETETEIDDSGEKYKLKIGFDKL
jgi:hypothetical protein